MKFAFLAGAVIALASPLVLAPRSALAAPTDYRLSVVSQTHQPDGSDAVTVHLVHLPDGQKVTGAVMFAPMVMMGGSMSMMAPAKITPAADGAAVVQVTPSMAGTWTISLSARVNGETAVIKGAVDVELGK
jgi:acetyl-CoA carboxylase beta subunit